MHILHIVNDFNATKVHSNLYKELDKRNITQSIFIPLRDNIQIGKNHFNFNTLGSDYIYSKKINLVHRIIFPYKISTLFKSVEKKVDITKIKLIHATTLFSDGAIAYKLHLKYNIPYVVAVRSTDLNVFFTKRKELIPLGLKILKRATKIIFISPSNKEIFINKKEIKPILNLLENKIIVMNNGIDNYWLDNISHYSTNLKEYNKINFLFIGSFETRKNIKNLVLALDKFRMVYKSNIQLNIVGGNGKSREKTLKFINNYSWIKFHGQINSKQELLKIYNQSDFFTLISHSETFGLVFIEALTQGKPLLYTKNQGIDGLFDHKIGEKVNSKDIDDIVLKINALISSNYDDINKIDFNQFYWKNIAKSYKQLYQNILK